MTNFYRCSDAGVFLQIDDMAAACESCGLARMPQNDPDADADLHVPEVFKEADGVKVKVGRAPHPMTAEHRIEWIYVKTSFGGMFARLFEGDAPEALFHLADVEAEEVYACCNLHGIFAAKTPVLSPDFDINKVACSPEFTAGCLDNGM